MYQIKCKSFTANQCNFEIQGANIEKMKNQMKDHLGTVHFKSKVDNLEIRGVMQKVDNSLMKSQKVINR